MRFQRQNYEKYLKSKNDIRMPLGPFNKELWAIQDFLISGKILKPSIHTENGIIAEKASHPLLPSLSIIWKSTSKIFRFIQYSMV